MQYTIEVEREDDGRWITEIPELPGVLAYGASREEAVTRAQALALRVLAKTPGTSSAGSAVFSVVEVELTSIVTIGECRMRLPQMA